MANFDRGHPGYDSLLQAYEAMCRVNKQINMEKKKKENAEKVVDIQNKTTGWNVRINKLGMCWRDIIRLASYEGQFLIGTCRNVGICYGWGTS